jgi:hypothetical protein
MLSGLGDDVQYRGKPVSFSLLRFLRRVPAESLKTYFDERRFDQTKEIDWDEKPPVLVQQVRTVIDNLEEQHRHRIFDDFERVSLLADDIGQLAIRSALADAPDLLDTISEMDSHEGRALLALLRRPEAFEHALSVAYAERLQYGRSWNRFSVRESRSPDHSAAARDVLSKEISRLFEAFDGSGRRVSIDIFERAMPGSLGSPADRFFQYTIYVEKLPESSLEFDKNGPARRTFRPAREAALCLDCGAGILDVLSDGGKLLRDKIACAFARIVLVDEAGLQPVRRRDFHLDRLKRPIGFPTDPRDRIVNVAVTQLGLAALDSKFGRVTIDVGRSTDESIYSASQRWFGDAEPIGRLDWRVVQAKIRIVFDPEEAGRRKKVVTAELRVPNSSNLKNQSWRHQLVSEKYIERWGLAAPG